PTVLADYARRRRLAGAALDRPGHDGHPAAVVLVAMDRRRLHSWYYRRCARLAAGNRPALDSEHGHRPASGNGWSVADHGGADQFPRYPGRIVLMEGDHGSGWLLSPQPALGARRRGRGVPVH